MNESLAGVPRDQILRRVRGEYLEMPGLRLTRAQAQRLWGLDPQICTEILDALTADGFLCQRDDGMYARLTDGAVPFPPLRMARADRLPPLAPPARTRNWS
jgi:hypothetical protein